jgi:hypothetical protein
MSMSSDVAIARPQWQAETSFSPDAHGVAVGGQLSTWDPEGHVLPLV